jgi:hypothetical protein
MEGSLAFRLAASWVGRACKEEVMGDQGRVPRHLTAPEYVIWRVRRVIAGSALRDGAIPEGKRPRLLDEIANYRPLTASRDRGA